MEFLHYKVFMVFYFNVFIYCVGIFLLKINFAFACTDSPTYVCEGVTCGTGYKCEVVTCPGGGYDYTCAASSSCFLPGTKLDMMDGTKKNIEDVKVGDWIKSYDPPHHVLIDKYGNTTNVYDDSELDSNHKVVNDDGTYTQYIYNTKLRAELKDKSFKPKLNIFLRFKNKIIEKLEKMVEYFTPLKRI